MAKTTTVAPKVQSESQVSAEEFTELQLDVKRLEVSFASSKGCLQAFCHQLVSSIANLENVQGQLKAQRQYTSSIRQKHMKDA